MAKEISSNISVSFDRSTASQSDFLPICLGLLIHPIICPGLHCPLVLPLFFFLLVYLFFQLVMVVHLLLMVMVLICFFVSQIFFVFFFL